jgi:hypothetical protein
MKELCTKIYESLLQQLDHQTTTKDSFTQQIEHSFIVCFNHWLQVTKQLSVHDFKNLREEVLFFKKIKPLFTTHIEYYNLLYHFQLFQPDYCSVKMKDFINAETNRLKKFISAHLSFYIYYKTGASYLDAVYFTQSAVPDSCLFAKVYNINPRFISSHDHLVSTLLALEKYTAWLQQLNR